MIRVAQQPPKDTRLQSPAFLGADLDRASLTGHFVAARVLSRPPRRVAERALLGWHLHHERSLPVVDLLDRDGGPLGWILGHAICPRRRSLIVGAPRLPIGVGDPDAEEAIEAWLYGNGGRWAAIVLAPTPQVYPDPFASLTVLFDPSSGTVASSPFLIPEPDGGVVDSALVSDVAIYRSGRYFPLGATCRAGVKMLLPSHRLDLATFEDERIWPRTLPKRVNTADAVERIGEILEATVAAVAAAGRISLSLTGGGDSRVLLACARDVADVIGSHTIRFPDPTGHADVALARRIAVDQGFAHEVPSWVRPSEEDVRRWIVLTGALTGESRGRRSDPTVARMAHRGVNLSGVGIEVARGRKWWPDDRPGTPLTSPDLFARLHLPSHASLLELGDRWLAQAPGLDALDLIDLFFLEICHGGWAGPLTFGHPRTFTTTLYPFAHREILELVLGLSVAYRRADGLRAEIIASRWPELGRYPVNPVSIRYAAVGKAGRLAQLPAGAVRRTRRRLRQV